MNILIFVCLFYYINALPEAGYFELDTKTKNNTLVVTKSAYNNTSIKISIFCNGNNTFKIEGKVSVLTCLKREYVTNSKSDSFLTKKIKCEKAKFIYLKNDQIKPYFGDFVRFDKEFLATTTTNFYEISLGIIAPRNSDMKVFLEIQSYYGYLSAADYPLLIFYGVMCGVYALLALCWFILCCYNWRDILRIQLCIGGVILLGMVEKAVYLSVYEKINTTGYMNVYFVLIAKNISCYKRALARVLLMIVCIGYGIVKPRLGPAFKKILAVGGVYLVAAIVESCISTLFPKLMHSKLILIPELVLIIVEALILWWSFSYLIHTIKQMRMRRNVVKFNLYRHFSNILIIVVITSVCFMIWALYSFQWSNCKNWSLVWVNDAFWHVEFSIVLSTIMVLWRPSRNNQRYAYSPLLDPEDSEYISDDEDNLPAHETVVMENLTSGHLRKQQHTGDGGANSNGAAQSASANDKTAEDDLKWIEEHIPASAAEKIYPLMDSDEELTPSKITAGKMD